MAEMAPNAKWYSPLEERIVRALTGGRWMTADAIADAIGESAGGDFRPVLRNLCERDVLESSQRHGYRLLAARTAANHPS